MNDPSYGWISVATYRRLLANARLKIDVNEKVWKPLGYATMVLGALAAFLGMADIGLASMVGNRIADLRHIRSLTTIRQLRGGYVVWEDATGRYLAIPNAILDSEMWACRNPSYQCIRVRKL